VIGPERLPRVARTLGHLFGRLQSYVAEVKADINREMELDELRKLQSTMQDAAREIEHGMSSEVRYVENEVKEAEEQAKQAVESAGAPLTGINLAP
jgi:sec-independent protein translocase protein TatB